MTQNKNNSISSCIDNDCCVLFPTSRFPYLILCPRLWKPEVATTYLAITTGTIKTFLSMKIPCC